MAISLKRKVGLYVKDVRGKGLGLFCSSTIAIGEIIEECIAIPFDNQNALHIDQTILYNYYFSLASLTDGQAHSLSLKNKLKSGCIALGLLSMANHSKTPNAETLKTICQGVLVITLKAKLPIKAEEEITLSYGKTWFEVAS